MSFLDSYNFEEKNNFEKPFPSVRNIQLSPRDLNESRGTTAYRSAYLDCYCSFSPSASLALPFFNLKHHVNLNDKSFFRCRLDKSRATLFPQGELCSYPFSVKAVNTKRCRPSPIKYNDIKPSAQDQVSREQRIIPSQTLNDPLSQTPGISQVSSFGLKAALSQNMNQTLETQGLTKEHYKQVVQDQNNLIQKMEEMKNKMYSKNLSTSLVENKKLKKHWQQAEEEKDFFRSQWKQAELLHKTQKVQYEARLTNKQYSLTYYKRKCGQLEKKHQYLQEKFYITEKQLKQVTVEMEEKIQKAVGETATQLTVKHDGSIQKLEEQCQRLETENNSLNSFIKQQDREFNELKIELETMSQLVKLKEDLVKSQQEQLQNMTHHDKATESQLLLQKDLELQTCKLKYQDAIDELNAFNVSSRKELEELQHQLYGTRSQLSELENEIQAKDNQINEKTQEYLQVISQMNSEISDYKASKEILQENINDIQAGLNSDLERLEEENSKYKQDIQELKEVMRKKTSEEQTNLQRITAENDTLREEIQHLKEAIREDESKKATDIERLTKENETYKEEIQQLEKTLKETVYEKEQNLKRLREENEKSNQDIQQLREAAKIKESEQAKELDRLTKETDKYKDQVTQQKEARGREALELQENLKNIMDENDKLKEEIIQLKKEITGETFQQQTNLKNLAEENDKYKREIIQLKEAMRREPSEHMEDIKNLTEENSKYKEEIMQLKETMGSEASRKEETIKELTKQGEKYKEEIELLKRMMEKNQQDTDSTIRTLKNEMQEIQGLTETKLSTAISAANEKSIQLQNQLSIQQASVQLAEEALSQVVDNIQQRIETRNTVINEMENELAKLEFFFKESIPSAVHIELYDILEKGEYLFQYLKKETSPMFINIEAIDSCNMEDAAQLSRQLKDVVTFQRQLVNQTERMERIIEKVHFVVPTENKDHPMQYDRTNSFQKQTKKTKTKTQHDRLPSFDRITYKLEQKRSLPTIVPKDETSRSDSSEPWTATHYKEHREMTDKVRNVPLNAERDNILNVHSDVNSSRSSQVKYDADSDKSAIKKFSSGSEENRPGSHVVLSNSDEERCKEENDATQPQQHQEESLSVNSPEDETKKAKNDESSHASEGKKKKTTDSKPVTRVKKKKDQSNKKKTPTKSSGKERTKKKIIRGKSGDENAEVKISLKRKKKNIQRIASKRQDTLILQNSPSSFGPMLSSRRHDSLANLRHRSQEISNLSKKKLAGKRDGVNFAKVISQTEAGNTTPVSRLLTNAPEKLYEKGEGTSSHRPDVLFNQHVDNSRFDKELLTDNENLKGPSDINTHQTTDTNTNVSEEGESVHSLRNQGNKNLVEAFGFRAPSWFSLWKQNK